MTREEKIEILEKEKAYMIGHGGDRQAIALDDAIKALKQEPCEDCISREEVISITYEDTNYYDPINILTEVRDKIKALPSVKKEPKTVSLSVYEQVRRERDIAVSQLQELGYELGEKVRVEKEPILDKIRAEIEQLRLHKAQFLTSDNKVCIDSQEVLDVIDKYRREK